MTSSMIQVSGDAVKAITLHGDYSKISENDRLSVVLSICDSLGLNASMNPFNWLKNEKTGAITLYPNKSCAAQLSSNRKLKCEIVKEGPLMDSVYSVTVRVTEGERTTEDCGVVSMTYFKKGDANGAGSWVRLEGGGLADAIMKAHTKATRRTVLKHCGLGLPDEKDEEVIYVMDDADIKIKDKPTPKTVAAEVVKAAEAKHDEAKKDGYQPPAGETEKPKDGKQKWTGEIVNAEVLELPDKRLAWALTGADGTVFKTDNEKLIESGIEKGKRYDVTYHPNPRGTLVIDKLKESKA